MTAAPSAVPPPRPRRGLRTRDFDRIHRAPERRRQSARFRVLACRNQGKSLRWGISVRARLGNAVVRNRVKRRLREILRRVAAEPRRTGWDVVVQPRDARVATAEFAPLARELETLLAQALTEDKEGR